MTGQSLLDTMELLNQELQLQTGEADVTRGLLALNIAQDFFEARAGTRPNIFGSSTGTLTQTINQEYTTWPTGLIRLDALQYLDPATLKPAWTLTPRFEVGSHAPSTFWPLNLTSVTATGKPKAFWTNGTQVYWDPVPDAANSVRWYGFTAAADLTASGTFAYPDILRLPIAGFATSLLKLGVEDDTNALDSLTGQVFDGILDQLGNFNRSGARALTYTTDHS